MEKKIIVETRQGLCNRMRVIASANKLAREVNGELVIMWPEDKYCNCDFFSIFQPIPGAKIKKYKGRVTAILTRKYHLLMDKRIFFDITTEDSEELINYVKDNKFVFISTVHNFYAQEKDYDIFHMTSEIEAKVEQIICKAHDLIGIHIRRSDNALSIQKSPTYLFVNKIKELILENNKYQFYLSTDSLEDEKLIQEIFGKKILVNANKQMKRNTVQGIIDAAIDLRCLSKCKKIYGSYYSSFSETAAFLGNSTKLEILKK